MKTPHLLLLFALMGPVARSADTTAYGTTSAYASTTAAPTTTTTEPEVECPNGWIDGDFLGCYKFLNAKVNLTWVDAQHQCELVGGYLAEPIDERQGEFLHGIGVLDQEFTGISYFYIGMADLGNEGNWFWLHAQEPVVDEFWAPNHPSNRSGNANDCGLMVLKNNEFWWEDNSCVEPTVHNHPVAPVCQRDVSVSAPTTEPPLTTTSCPFGWTQFGTNCYKYFSTNSRWTTAEFDCAELGGRLASVHSSEEDSFLRSLANQNYYWMGGRYTSNTGYRWSDGTPWDYDDMSSCSDSYCVYYSSNYNDWRCTYCDESSSSYRYPYICKI